MKDSEINTVNHGGSIAMSQKTKVSIEEKVKIMSCSRHCTLGEFSTTWAAPGGAASGYTSLHKKRPAVYRLLAGETSYFSLSSLPNLLILLGRRAIFLSSFSNMIFHSMPNATTDSDIVLLNSRYNIVNTSCFIGIEEILCDNSGKD